MPQASPPLSSLAALEIRDLAKSFDRPAVDGLALRVRGGEFYTLLGPNGRVVSGTLPSVIQRWFRTHRPTSRQQVTFNSVGEVRVAIDPITRRKGGIVGYLLVWQSLRSIETATHSLLFIMLAAGPILILAAWFASECCCERKSR